MFVIKFKEFDFQGFINFILELVDKHRMIQIRFFPERKELFDETQLRHIAPDRTINDPGGFVWAWVRKQKEVRKVTFDLFSDDRRLQITMTINLNNKTISLDKAEGISPIQVEEVLKNNFGNNLSTSSAKESGINLFYLIWSNKIITGVIIVVVGGLILRGIKWNQIGGDILPLPPMPTSKVCEINNSILILSISGLPNKVADDTRALLLTQDCSVEGPDPVESDKVPSASEVTYFNEGDHDKAGQIAKYLNDHINNLNLTQSLSHPDPKKTPKTQFEIWIK